MTERLLHIGSDFDLLLVFLAVVLMPLVSALAGAQLSRRKPVSLVPRYWQTMIRGWVMAALVVLVWFWLGRPFSDLGLSADPGFWGRAGFAFVALAAAALALQLVRLKPLSPEKLERAKKAFEGMKISPNTRAELALFVLVAITAGIWEELLYRGYLLWLLAPSFGLAGAVAISSLVFGLGHLYQGPTGVAYTTLVGLVFAVFYLLTQSLWWLMAAHALIDIYAGCLTWRIKRMAAAAAPR